MDCVLYGIIVDSIGNDPWNVLVIRWGSKCHLVLKRVSLCAVIAAQDAAHIGVTDFGVFGTTFDSSFIINCSSPAAVIMLNTVSEVELYNLVSDIVVRAGFDLIPDALDGSMLATVFPSISYLSLVSITVRVKGDFGHVEEVWGGKGFGEGVFNCASAAWALGLVEELDLDLVGSVCSGKEGGN